MTKVYGNLITKGASGQLGKQIVFRQSQGDTIMSKFPQFKKSIEESELSKANKLRFKSAVMYAKKALNDPELKQSYKKKCKPHQNAYTRAVEDFLNAPVVEEIDLSAYTGEPDSYIRVYATDDFRVNRVLIRIENQQSEVVETGAAVREGNTDWWRFTVTGPHPLSGNGKVAVSAFDLPGNEAMSEVAV